MAEEFKKKKDELKKTNLLESQTRVVRLKYGNTHRMNKKPAKTVPQEINVRAS